MPTYYDAFISYARKDSKQLGIKLNQRLQEEGLKVWFDQNDIPPAVDWQAQIDDGITRAHNFLFLISPHSVKSQYCRLEIELAVKLNKRILPLLHVDADEHYEEMHPIIRETNWLFWLESSDKFKFETSIVELLETIKKHEDYVQQHTHYLVSALDWQKQQKQTQYLLIGEDRVKAEQWLKVRFNDIEQQPCSPTDLHCEYICESTKNANNLLTQVFISSTEKDEIARNKLVKYLHRQGITTWTNKSDSNSGIELETQINQGIEGADNFIFLVSVDSVENYYPQRELQHAFKYNKRIIPIFLDKVKSELIPVEIQGLESLDNLEAENLAELVRILKEEEVYYQKHKLLLVKALKWESQNRNRSLLLRGYNLQHFEAWFNTAVSRRIHPPLPIQSDFLQASKGQTTDEVLDVFISYSRADADFARKLNDRLQGLGKTTWFDQESIAVGEDFKREIEKGIEASDNFVFIISPRSINSPYCADEVEHAFMLNKRFITILVKEVESKDLHLALSRVQWINFSKGDFWLHFNELVRVLDTDREHVREHSKWSQRALEWAEKGKSGDLLLRGGALEGARGWLKETESKKVDPAPTELQREYINRSRSQRRRNRGLLIGSVLGVIGVLSTVSVVSLNLWRRAEEQTRQLKHREAMLKAESLQSSQPVEALVSAIEAFGFLDKSKSKELLPQIKDTLFTATYSFKGLFTYHHDAEVNSVQFSPDGRYILSGSWDNTVRLWDTQGNLLHTYQHDDVVSSVQFSPDGQYIVSGSRDNTVRLWDIQGNLLHTYHHDDRVRQVQFSPDGQYIVSVVYSDNNTVRLWDTQGNLLHSYQHGGDVNSVQFSPDGQYILSIGITTMRLWDTQGNLLYTYNDDASLYSVQFSPDSKYILSHSNDNRISLWSTQGTLLHIYRHDTFVTSVQFSPDSNYIVSGSRDNTVRLWDIQGNLLHTYQHDAEVWSVQFSPDGQYIVSGDIQNRVSLWATTGKLLHTYHHSSVQRWNNSRGNEFGVNSVQFSPDGQYILSGGSDDNILKLWDTEGNLLHSYQHDGIVNSVQFSPDGQYILSGSDDNTVILWDIINNSLKLSLWDNNNLLHSYQHDGGVYSVQFSPDGRYIVSGSRDATVRLWDTEGNLLHSYQHDGGVYSVQFSPDGQYIVSGSEDNTVRLWDTQGNLLHTYQHDGGVNSVQFSPDGQYIVSVVYSDNNTVRLWDIEGNLLHSYHHDDRVNSVQFSPDGQYIVSGSRDNTVKLSNIEGNLLHTYHHDDRVRQVQFSPDGQYIVSVVYSDNNTVKLWDTEGNLLHTYQHDGGVRQVQFSPDGQYIVSGSYATVKLWDTEGNLLHSYQHDDWVNSVQFSPDGQYIVSDSDDNIVRLWDIEGNLLHTYQHDDRVWSVQFSPDGRYILSGSYDNTVRLWDTQGNLLHTYQHDDEVRSVQFSPDGRYILSGSSDNTVRLWSTQNWRKALKVGCDRLRHHPVFREPQTESHKNAKATCEEYVWNELRIEN